MIERSVDGDAPRPRPESAFRVEPGARAIDASEGFDSEIFGRSWIADDVNNPIVDLALMLAEQRLEGIEVAVTELPQHVGWLFQHRHLLSFYIRLRRGGHEGYMDLLRMRLKVQARWGRKVPQKSANEVSRRVDSR